MRLNLQQLNSLNKFHIFFLLLLFHETKLKHLAISNSSHSKTEPKLKLKLVIWFCWFHIRQRFKKRLRSKFWKTNETNRKTPKQDHTFMRDRERQRARSNQWREIERSRTESPSLTTRLRNRKLKVRRQRRVTMVRARVL